MTWTGSLVAALLAALAHPRWWVLALAAFLVRGGVVAVLVPIVVPPTVAGVSTMLAPTIVAELITGTSDLPAGVLFVIVAACLFAVVTIGGTLGTWFEAEVVAEAAADDDLSLGGGAPGPRPPGLATARLGPHVVTAGVLALSTARVVAVVYAEATSPGSPTTPFVVRVASQTAPALVAIVGAWLLAEAAGGLAIRSMLLADARAAPRSPRQATWRGARRLLRPAPLATLAATSLALVVVAAPGALAAGRAWAQLRLLLVDGADAGALAIGLFLFVAVVLGWLALIAVALAWRMAAWTVVAGEG